MDRDLATITAIILAVMIPVAIVCIIGIAEYIVASVARYKYLKFRQYENPIAAFIPIWNTWAVVEATYDTHSELVRFYTIKYSISKTIVKLWKLLRFLLGFFIVYVPFIGALASSAIQIAILIIAGLEIYTDVIERIKVDNSIPEPEYKIVLSLIIPFFGPIYLISLMRKNGIQEGVVGPHYREDPRQLSTQIEPDNYNKKTVYENPAYTANTEQEQNIENNEQYTNTINLSKENNNQQQYEDDTQEYYEENTVESESDIIYEDNQVEDSIETKENEM